MQGRAAICQYVREQRKTYRFTIRTTKVTGLFAVWSHLKLQEPLDVNLGKPFSEHACYKAVKDRVFMTESKHTLPLEINRELVYKDIGHGAVVLTKDEGGQSSQLGQQSGASVQLSGRQSMYRRVGFIRVQRTNVQVSSLPGETSIHEPYYCTGTGSSKGSPCFT